ncbi:hypothetical protein PPERSA_12482 [Pseudocohnilembus persalinus]|uniref:Ubiquitin carboxyl-terminal hydrolase n=1 Tax=Pseudocohnilembus persalinus TaxID=266149 RepID=A0A0V0QNT3_PSEPJ|nr:hypothetical protein PPERSA_12482 [Pseudocohnilembus persalinus]|eukprot:KRX04035.1 hypothetical protein PPERSA_12482 [Pseudocohnilembus persalinus]
MDNGEWCTIESDPGVFTELIKGIGVKNCQVEEIYSLQDEHLLNDLGEIFGLIFLFKWVKQEPRKCLSFYDQDLFFCNQVIQNACATQALLSVLLNNEKIQTGSELQYFKQETKDFDPQLRGEALSNQELIRTVHNSFQKPEPFDFYQDPNDKQKGDAYHFISYVPFKGKVYELDGLQKGPILIGDIKEGQNWIDIAKEEINGRIKKYSEQEVMFNLMAVIQDKRQMAEKEIQDLNTRVLKIYQDMKSQKVALSEEQQKDHDQLQNIIKQEWLENTVSDESIISEEVFNKELNELKQKINHFQDVIQQENYKAEEHRVENVRRKHNYIPFILELLKMTAKKGKLPGLIEQAKKKQQEKNEMARQRKLQQQQGNK